MGSNTGQLLLQRERMDLAELVHGVVERLSEDLSKARCVPRLERQEHPRGCILQRVRRAGVGEEPRPHA